MQTSESTPLFTLSVASEILGVHPRTLMIYEKEGLLTPSRTKTNRRRFSKEDIQKLGFIRYLTTRKGINLAGVAVILELIELALPSKPSIVKDLFPEYSDASIF